LSTWNDLIVETQASGSTHDVIRRKYLRELQSQNKRNVIIYYSGWLQKPELVREPGVPIGITDEDKNGFMSVIHGLDRKKGLDLVLHTPGGDMAATESLVEYLRAMFGEDIRAIVPQIAMSGGTLIALSCKKIIMGKESSIGPIDPQFGPLAATGLLQEFKRIRSEIKADPTSALLWQPILSKINPGFITECENAVKWSAQMAEKFLLSNMLKGKRNKAKLAKDIVKSLTDKATTITHGRHIGFAEAAQIFGNGVEALEKNQKFQDAVLTVHHSTMITLGATPAVKIIENHTGKAFVKRIQAQLIQVPAQHR
jgi:hypothetical protein